MASLVERSGVHSTHGSGQGRIKIPLFVDAAITALQVMDCSVEGIFRKNGNIRKLRDATEMVDNQGAKLTVADLADQNSIQVSALLKKFLREMSEPLLTHKLYRLFLLSQG